MKSVRLLTIILAAVFCLSATTVSAKENRPSRPEKIIDQFFNMYSDNEVGEAIDFLYSYNFWAAQRIADKINDIKIQLMQDLPPVLGNYVGNEVISSSQIGKSFVVYRYMVKFDHQPLNFVFTFYKPADEWIVYGFSFDNKLNQELVDAASIE